MGGPQRKCVYPKVPISILFLTACNNNRNNNNNNNNNIYFYKLFTKEVPYWLLHKHHLRNMLFETSHNIYAPNCRQRRADCIVLFLIM
jgi:hypothetical protein